MFFYFDSFLFLMCIALGYGPHIERKKKKLKSRFSLSHVFHMIFLLLLYVKILKKLFRRPPQCD